MRNDGADFGLMKDLSRILHKSPSDREREIKNLLKQMGQFEKVQDVQKKWQIEIDHKPLKVEGQHM